MTVYRYRLPWRKLTPEKQKKVAEDAAKFGVRRACELNTVSETAVRTACAINGVIPKRMVYNNDKPKRIASALSVLRQLGLTPEDLLSHDPKP